MKTHIALLLLAVGGAVACSQATKTDSSANGNLNGEWTYVRASNEPPGFSLDVTLELDGATVAGSGTWQGEAMPGGVVNASGSATGNHVSIDLALVRNATGTNLGSSAEHFDGAFTSNDDLEGTKTIDGVTSPM